MRTLKDILEVPLVELKEGIKEWVDGSCKFWESWLDQRNVSAAFEAGKEATQEKTEDKPEAPKIPDDLAAVVEYNKAIVEKYQASGAESLLKHLVAQLAKERGIKDLEEKLDPTVETTIGEALLEELKGHIDVSPEKRELLNLPKAERAEHIVSTILAANSDAITKIMNGDKEIVKELDEKVIEGACGTVDTADLKYALRSMIQIELHKLQSASTDA
jgi:Asp-tRNA(Asn)/Glu-tRNA(Gln) amidotransferase B subunit